MRIIQRCAKHRETLLGGFYTQGVYRLTPSHAEFFGRDYVFKQLAILKLTDAGVGGDADFVKPIVSSNNKHMLAAKSAKHIDEQWNPLGSVNTHYLIRRACRIGQRSKHIKYGAYANFFAGRDHVFHSAMVGRRKHKANAYLIDAPSDGFGREA